MDDERERIVEKKSNVRTPQEKSILREIRQSRRRDKRVDEEPKFKPASERAADFSRWSGDDGFPKWALDFVKAQNKEKKLSPIDSYGYRRFYWRYVENIPVEEMGDVADRGDSEVEETAA